MRAFLLRFRWFFFFFSLSRAYPSTRLFRNTAGGGGGGGVPTASTAKFVRVRISKIRAAILLNYTHRTRIVFQSQRPPSAFIDFEFLLRIVKFFFFFQFKDTVNTPWRLLNSTWRYNIKSVFLFWFIENIINTLPINVDEILEYVLWIHFEITSVFVPQKVSFPGLYYTNPIGFYYTKCVQKISRTFKFRGLRESRYQ